MVFAVDRFHRALEPSEQGLCSNHRRAQIDGIAQLIHILEYLVKPAQMLHNHISVFFENGNGDEEVEVCREVVGPEAFPQTQHVQPGELALVPDEQHAEEEEKVCRVDGLEVEVKFWVEQLDEVVQGGELEAHAALVAEEVSFLRASHVSSDKQSDEIKVLTMRFIKFTKPQKATASSCMTA